MQVNIPFMNATRKGISGPQNSLITCEVTFYTCIWGVPDAMTDDMVDTV